jgi:hypothetical protein
MILYYHETPVSINRLALYYLPYYKARKESFRAAKKMVKYSNKFHNRVYKVVLEKLPSRRKTDEIPNTNPNLNN